MNSKIEIQIPRFQPNGVSLISQRVFAAGDAFREYDAQDDSIISSDDGWRRLPFNILAKTIYHAHPETCAEQLGFFLVQFEERYEK